MDQARKERLLSVGFVEYYAFLIINFLSFTNANYSFGFHGWPDAGLRDLVEVNLFAGLPMGLPPKWHRYEAYWSTSIRPCRRSSLIAKPVARACALCHLPTGNGHPESASLAGLPAAYIMRQMAEFKNGGRKAGGAVRAENQILQYW